MSRCKFKLTTTRRFWVLKQVDKCLKEFKHSLFAENFLKYKYHIPDPQAITQP